MRKFLLALPLVLVAGPAWAETQQDSDWCYSPSATDQQTIQGCTAMLASGKYSGSDLSHVYNNLTVAYIDLSQLDMALQESDIAIQLDPKNAEAYYNRCIIETDKGSYDVAIQNCTLAISLKSNYIHAFNHRGLAYEKKGSRGLAIADYQTAVRSDPTDTFARDALKRLGASQ